VQIERSLPKIKSPEIRHNRTTDLAKRRTALKQIQERLDSITEEVEEQHMEEEEEEEDEEDGEDLLADTPTSTASAVDGEDEKIEKGEHESGMQSQKDTVTTTATATESTIRQRHQSSTRNTIPPTSNSSSTSTALFSRGGNNPPSETNLNDNVLPPTESTLTSHRLEQESLTDSLVTLASHLKASSQAFQTSLESEKGILDRAVEGLDRNVSGMEAAGKRMGVLRRMGEGRGWWGRMLMYAWIFGLWLVAIMIVYVGPKLRF
jgi:hypothetical protein